MLCDVASAPWAPPLGVTSPPTNEWRLNAGCFVAPPPSSQWNRSEVLALPIKRKNTILIMVPFTILVNLFTPYLPKHSDYAATSLDLAWNLAPLVHIVYALIIPTVQWKDNFFWGDKNWFQLCRCTLYHFWFVVFWLFGHACDHSKPLGKLCRSLLFYFEALKSHPTHFKEWSSIWCHQKSSNFFIGLN